MSFKFELRNVEYSPRMSEETNCFTGMLYVDGKRVGTVTNRGQGGPTTVVFGPEHRELEQRVEAYVAAHPPKVYPRTKTTDEFSTPYSMEVLGDEIFEDWFYRAEYPKNFSRQFKEGRVVLLCHDWENLAMVLPKSVATLPEQGQVNYVKSWAVRNGKKLRYVWLDAKRRFDGDVEEAEVEVPV